MQINELSIDVATVNRIAKIGIQTVEELREEMYKPDTRISEPDAFRCERAMKAAGLAKYVRGDEVDAGMLANATRLTWDSIRDYVGKLAFVLIEERFTQKVRVCWIYSIDGSCVTYRAGRKQYESATKTDVERAGGKFYALPDDAQPVAQIVATDKQRAEALHRQIKSYGNIMMQSFYGLCTAIKQMRDTRLYKQLGYPTFEGYTEKELGMKKVQAYSYITIADKLTEDFVQSTEQIGVQKLYLLATAQEEVRTEIVQNTDLTETTVRELKAQIAALQAQNADSEKARTDAEKRAREWYEQAQDMQDQIAELESRPVEIAVPEPSREVQNLQDAMRKINLEHEKWSARIQDEHFKQVQEIHKKYRAELEALRKQQPEQKQASSFTAYYNFAQYAIIALWVYLKREPDEPAKEKTVAMLRRFLDEMEE